MMAVMPAGNLCTPLSFLHLDCVGNIGSLEGSGIYQSAGAEECRKFEGHLNTASHNREHMLVLLGTLYDHVLWRQMRQSSSLIIVNH